MKTITGVQQFLSEFVEQEYEVDGWTSLLPMEKFNAYISG
jgi:hypothetical protein